nr:Rho GTPase-activating protein [Ipomoea batatas]
MSVLQYPQQGLNPSDLQVWNNAAFDHGESEDLERSWPPLEPLSLKNSESFESVSGKENQIPLLENPAVCADSPRPVFKPIKPENSPGVVNLKPGLVSKNETLGEEIRDEKKIDKEIEEVEMEISRLSSRLKSLRMEKAEKCVKNVEKRGRVVTAKFMEPKQSLSVSAKSKAQRRGLSLGPSEISAGIRRGLSMGPSEIFSASKSPQLCKQGMITPIQSIQNRRKSCLWKLQEIDEENHRSLSPKSRKTMAKTLPPRQAITTVQSKKTVKKDEAVLLSSVQPKKLFRDGEKSVLGATKKPLKQGRIVASRYNQNSVVSSSMRKRSFPENDKDDGKRCDKKRSLSIGKSGAVQAEIKNLGTETRAKKKWEIPDEIVLHREEAESEKSPGSSTSVVPDMLPRIRIARCVKESPRDSGPAKRVAELVGKKSFFSKDEEEDVVEPAVCQALSFADEDEEEEEALSSANEDA